MSILNILMSSKSSLASELSIFDALFMHIDG